MQPFSRLMERRRARSWARMSRSRIHSVRQIISMWVDPSFRRVGVGKALIEAVLEWNKSRDVHEVKLMVTSINQGAIAFYGRMGSEGPG
jgi:ribosomal protein S18 acetylase RimI-like enzyme